jgi:hypothetical protein
MKIWSVAAISLSAAIRICAQVEPVATGEAPAAITENKAHLEYISRYKNIAIKEMHRMGVPASITLAQAILESNGGKSELAQQANNHFGIKCGLNWDGKTYMKMDDDKAGDSILVLSCFRKYNKAEESFYDHSEFFCDPAKHGRYSSLFLLDQTDYKNWAQGLESAGYATSKDYAEKLINLIERYMLFQYDVIGADSLDSIGYKENRIGYVNKTKAVWSRANERLEDIAELFQVNMEKLAEYNERRYLPGIPLKPNTRIFIEEKKKKWRGQSNRHVIQKGQTMFDVSQQYGIRLSELLKRNQMPPTHEPLAGDTLRLRKSRLFDRKKSSSAVAK